MENIKPICPMCKGEEFQKEEGSIDSKWGVTAHKTKILICANCQYVLLFSEGNSIINFD